MKKRNRSLTLVGAFLVLLIAFAIWDNLNKPETTIKSKPVTAQSVTVRKTKIRKPEPSGEQKISSEVQRRLATVGYKSDSFIAVKTNKYETKTTNPETK